ncbi:hypothetical protein ACT3CD_05155 [Geofilum sp. OHC36d9]
MRTVFEITQQIVQSAGIEITISGFTDLFQQKTAYRKNNRLPLLFFVM